MNPSSEQPAVIRRCTNSDVAVIASTEPPSKDYARRAFARQQRGELHYLVAWAGSKPVGSIEVTCSLPAELANLRVDPDHRSRGIGRLLIAAAEQLVPTGVEITIGVAIDNPRAAALYHALGYRDSGEVVSYHYSYVDEQNITHTVDEVSQVLIKSPTAASS